jgi:hypothetical protein
MARTGGVRCSSAGSDTFFLFLMGELDNQDGILGSQPAERNIP